MTKRVLCYSPYNLGQIHALWEMTILHALGLRGADIRYVFCDSVYPMCDVYKPGNPKTAFSCLQCQKAVTDLALSMQINFQWLGRYLLPSEVREARDWAAAIPDDRLLAAEADGLPIGEWVRSSVHTHFRCVDLDLDDPETVRIARGYVEAGFLAARALGRLLDDFDPDAVLLFNARMSSLRIMFELARARGIPVVVHERGRRRGTLRVLRNEVCFGNRHIVDMHEQWGEIPLVRPEIEAIERELLDRAYGRKTNYLFRTVPMQEPAAVAAELGLDPAKPLWLVLPSSDDEYVGFPEFYPSFPSIRAWSDAVAEFARDNPDIQFVFRVHPNIGAITHGGSNLQQTAYYQGLKARAPSNVRVVMPGDKVSTYSLMELAAVGVVLHSTTGYEMTARGVRTISGGSPRFDFLSLVENAGSPAEFRSLLEAAKDTPPGARDATRRRLGCRFAYRYFFKLDLEMPMVDIVNPGQGRIAYKATSELAPGRWPTLDKACRIILEDESPITPPTDADRARTDGDERAWFKG